MSKELEELEELNYNLGLTKTTTYINHYYDIKNALLKAQEQEKVFSIISNKCVGNDNLFLVKNSINYKHYLEIAKLGIDNIININLKENDLLTQEEFDLLKRWSECQKN